MTNANKDQKPVFNKDGAQKVNPAKIEQAKREIQQQLQQQSKK